MTQELTTWTEKNQLAEVKKLFAKDLTDNEFNILVGIGKSTGLNPYLREIWAVKYGEAPASIFIGRDGYRKSAQANADYDYHIPDAVYSNDTFTVEDGVVKHTYTLSERGSLVGAYCTVKRKSASKASFTYVEFAEYYQGYKNPDGTIKQKQYKGKTYASKPTLWDTKPATMIKKVAEAQGLRQTFQELFAGTYDESENWREAVDVQGEVVDNMPETPPKAPVIDPKDVQQQAETAIAQAKDPTALTELVERLKASTVLSEPAKLMLAGKAQAKYEKLIETASLPTLSGTDEEGNEVVIHGQDKADEWVQAQSGSDPEFYKN
jgi:phage recombination protein Bet